jgi:hypothetical protein
MGSAMPGSDLRYYQGESSHAVRGHVGTDLNALAAINEVAPVSKEGQ